MEWQPPFPCQLINVLIRNTKNVSNITRRKYFGILDHRSRLHDSLKYWSMVGSLQLKHYNHKLTLRVTPPSPPSLHMAQVQCPKCGSYKTMSDRMIALAVGIGLLLVGGLFGVFVFPLFLIPIGFIFILVAIFQKAKKWTCNACKYKFPASEVKK